MLPSWLRRLLGLRPPTNAEIRRGYLAEIMGIAAHEQRWRAKGLPIEERARKAYALRFRARSRARAAMGDPIALKMLRQRNQKKYGDPEGPTFEWLLARARSRGLDDDAAYLSILESALRTDAATNRKWAG